MTTKILSHNIDSRFNNEIMNSKFTPKMKYDNSQYYSYDKENYEINSHYRKNDEENKVNKMNFLFPSVPIEVSEKFLIIYLQTIKFILPKNNNLSIDEGIEKLKSLTISERYKNNNINSEKETEKKNIIYSNNIINNSTLPKFMQNSNNNMNNNANHLFHKRKRNYLSLINSYKRNEIINRNLDVNINNNHSNGENINNENKIEKNKLLDVDILSNELLKTKNQEELKNILFQQLILLDQKIKKEKEIEQIKESINILEKDELDLTKCQKVVTRALCKKIHSKNELDKKDEELKEEILKIINRIVYYQSYGDFFIKELNERQNKLDI